MKTNTLLLVSGIASAFYAFFLLAAPTFFLELHGLTTDAIGLLFIRTTGALSIGYALLGLLGCKTKSEDGLKLAIHTNLGGWVAMFFVMLFAKFTLQFNSFIFIDLGFCALFSILFLTKAIAKK